MSDQVVYNAKDFNKNLGKIKSKAYHYHGVGDLFRAELFFKRALELVEGHFPPDNERVAKELDNYSSILRKLGRVEEAIQYEKRSRFIREKGHSPQPLDPRQRPETVVALVELSEVPGSIVTPDLLRCEKQPSDTPVVPPPVGLSTPLVSKLSIADSYVGNEESHVSDADLLHLKSLIIRLEEFLGWESMDEGWADRREGWGEEICSATTVNELGGLIADLELHLFLEAYEESWASVREDWSAGCVNATGLIAIVEALIVLEDHIRFAAFRDGWVEERTYWGRMVQWCHPD